MSYDPHGDVGVTRKLLDRLTADGGRYLLIIGQEEATKDSFGTPVRNRFLTDDEYTAIVKALKARADSPYECWPHKHHEYDGAFKCSCGRTWGAISNPTGMCEGCAKDADATNQISSPAAESEVLQDARELRGVPSERSCAQRG